MAKVIFPGSFDPPTYGHLNIIERARRLFDEVHVIIAANPGKNSLFTPEERLAMLRKLTVGWNNLHLALYDGLTVDYARAHKIRLLLRGIRNVPDFSYEFDLSLMNRVLDNEIETVFMPTEPRYFVLKSSSIKEMASIGGDVSTMVPPLVVKALESKYPRRNAGAAD
jgi:pantetheine-phosphate adenylyltransferase